MKLTRRNFFQSVIAAAAAGTLMTDPVVAAGIKAFANDRVSIAIQDAKELVALSKPLMVNRLDNGRQTPEYANYIKEADGWVNFLLDAFPEEPNHDHVEMIFEGLIRIESLDDSKLHDIAVGLLPIALTRLLVQTYRQPFHMQRMTSFVAFAERYREAIMNPNLSKAYLTLRLQSEFHTGTPAQKEFLVSYYDQHIALAGKDKPIKLSSSALSNMKTLA